MNYSLLSQQLIQAIRGHRRSSALSRKLGFKSNPVQSWEMGRRSPSAAGFLRFAETAGTDVESAMVRFLGLRPRWLAHTELCSRDGIAALLNDLRGKRAVIDIARSLGVSRFQVLRWLSGDTEPKLPEFLRLLDNITSRLLDFIALITDIEAIPLVCGQWHALEAARQSAYDAPESHAVLRVLELGAYQRLPRHRSGFIAEFLGITLEEERRCIEILLESQQIEWQGERLRLRRAQTVDINRDPAAATRLKLWATERGKKHLTQGKDGLFSYNLFCVSAKDHARIQELHRAYFRELRAIVASSQPAERVVLTNLQLFELGRMK